MNDNVGGAETELRLHSMERVFCSQTLATPTLCVGEHLLAAGCAQAVQWSCEQPSRVVCQRQVWLQSYKGFCKCVLFQLRTVSPAEEVQ